MNLVKDITTTILKILGAGTGLSALIMIATMINVM